MVYYFISSLKQVPPALILTATFLLPLSYAAKANASGAEDHFIQETERGQIDWVKGVVRSKGATYESATDNSANVAVKKMKTLRLAKIEAMRNIIETMKSIRVDSSSTIGNYMEGSSYIRKKMHEIVRAAKVIEKNPLDDGGMEITIELPLKGLLMETMIQGGSDVKLPARGEELYTGLIIDARGLELKPALSPKVLNEYGRAVFSTSVVKRGALLSRGLVAYSSKVEYAERSSRVADRPLLIRALRKSGLNGVNLVISREDEAKIKDPSSNMSWLAECRVILLID
ncbi:MAG: hypothetical protein OEV42_04530 [Deltaproteobacteria bacterium]|nr:hypothetical protein [Deltaproteobacteria bacterium]